MSPGPWRKSGKKIKELSYEGIHFLDSGNYHYLSKFWLEKIEEPFSLLVFDNHTDMQEAAFFGLLSCGSWVKDQLDTNGFLKEVCVLGPSRQAFEECSREDRRRIREIPAEEFSKENLLEDFLERNSQLPLYLSIDKDLLSTEAARTNWDPRVRSVFPAFCPGFARLLKKDIFWELTYAEKIPRIPRSLPEEKTWKLTEGRTGPCWSC